MPVVTIEWYEGRSAEQKRQIAEGLTALLSEFGGTAPEQVWIRFVDSAKSDWAVGGVIQGGVQGSAEEPLGPPE
ncbi:MAG TPA: tautomerase family protein [Thermoleophilaceae bacterium]|nr:tautomerase family protein [Thermoleophilaceae bacterium]